MPGIDEVSSAPGIDEVSSALELRALGPRTVVRIITIEIEGDATFAQLDSILGHALPEVDGR